MTRDEAIKIFIEKRPSYMTDSAAWVDLCVSLGMLKLDEPKISIEAAFCNALYKAGIGHHDRDRVKAELNAAGLKIVEKDKP